MGEDVVEIRETLSRQAKLAQIEEKMASFILVGPVTLHLTSRMRRAGNYLSDRSDETH